MASKENLNRESYERQIAGLTPYAPLGDRQTSKKPVKIYVDQEETLGILAKRQGKTRAALVRDAVDYFLKSLDENIDKTSNGSVA